MSTPTMEEEEEKPKAFKVQDRRRFSSEGDAKTEADVQDIQEIQPETPEVSAGTKPAEQVQSVGANSQFQTEPASDHTKSELTFATFLVSLSTQALMLLGEIPDPMTDQKIVDLPGAQQLIDILGMLQEKTRGNLGQDEAGLLDSILFDLRMKYVEVARAASR